jgi:hypothetical protein
MFCKRCLKEILFVDLRYTFPKNTLNRKTPEGEKSPRKDWKELSLFEKEDDFCGGYGNFNPLIN